MRNVTMIRHKFAIGTGALMLAIAPLVCSGQDSIGINFAGRQWSAGGNISLTLDSSDGAGVINQQNWNNVFLDGANSGGMAQLNLGQPNEGLVSDSGGSLTSVTFSYTQGGNATEWSVDQTVHTGTQQLLNGYWDIQSGSGAVNIGNISFSLYDVYVYVSSDANGRTAGVALNGGPQTFLLTDAKDFDYSNPLTQALATTQDSAIAAQYVRYQSVSGSDFQIDLTSYGADVGFAGLQIVAVPEPSTLALSAVALTLLVGIRRRTK